MAVVVRQPSVRTIAVTQGQQNQSSITVKRAADLTVQSLTNVVSTDLQDGYTLIYDSDTGKFVTSALDAGIITAVDGGTY